MRKLVGLLLAAMVVVGMAGPAAAATGRQDFRLVQVGGESAPTRVIATGVVNAVGSDVELTSVDNSDGSSSGTDRFDFANGSLFISHQENGDFSFDPRTCVGRFSFTGTYQITGGTNSYVGATGSGTDTGQGVFLANRNPDGSCSEETEATSVFFASLTGTLTTGRSSA